MKELKIYKVIYCFNCMYIYTQLHTQHCQSIKMWKKAFRTMLRFVLKIFEIGTKRSSSIKKMLKTKTCGLV